MHYSADHGLRATADPVAAGQRGCAESSVVVKPSQTVDCMSCGAVASCNAQLSEMFCPACPRIADPSQLVLAHSWRNRGLVIKRSVALSGPIWSRTFRTTPRLLRIG